MSATATLLVAAAAALLPRPQSSAEELSNGRFRAALEAAAVETDPLQRARQRADVFYTARDFRSVLETCRAGVGETGVEDPWLLWRAAGAALWMRRGELASSWAERLLAAAEANESDASRAEFWRAQAGAFLDQAADLVEADGARSDAVARARLTVAGWFAGLAAVALFVRRTGTR